MRTVEPPNNPTGPGENADVPEGNIPTDRSASAGRHRSSEGLRPTGYVIVEATCQLLAVVLIVGGVYRVGVWLLVLPVFDLVALTALAALIVSMAGARTYARVITLYALGVACIAYTGGLLLGWYWRTLASHADVGRAIKATALLVTISYVGSIVIGLLPVRAGRLNFIRLIVGVLLPLLLLATSLVSFYHTATEFIRTLAAILVTCHLTYEYTAVTHRPRRFKFILDLTLAFTIDLVIIVVLLLGV